MFKVGKFLRAILTTTIARFAPRNSRIILSLWTYEKSPNHKPWPKPKNQALCDESLRWVFESRNLTCTWRESSKKSFRPSLKGSRHGRFPSLQLTWIPMVVKAPQRKRLGLWNSGTTYMTSTLSIAAIRRSLLRSRKTNDNPKQLFRPSQSPLSIPVSSPSKKCKRKRTPTESSEKSREHNPYTSKVAYHRVCWSIKRLPKLSKRNFSSK